VGAAFMFTNRRTVVPALVVGAMGLVTAVTGCTATVTGHPVAGGPPAPPANRYRPSDASGEGRNRGDFYKK
jgi:hypothetical protein